MPRPHVVIQAGHAGRTRGFTGTSGPFGAEKVWTAETAKIVCDLLGARGWTAVWTKADAPVPDSAVFVALHQDGSVNKAARGPSVGYPKTSAASKEGAQVWKATYALHYPGPSFRPDNYTLGLARYYGCNPSRRAGSSAPTRFVCEHGFATNYQDAEWMWSDEGRKAVADSIEAVLWHVHGDDVLRYVAALDAAKGQGQQGKAQEAATPPSAPLAADPVLVVEPAAVGASQPTIVKPVSDSNARATWTALTTAVPALSAYHLVGLEDIEQWHLIALTLLTAGLSYAKSFLAGVRK